MDAARASDPSSQLPNFGLGVVGFGGFGQFAVQQLVQIPGVQLRVIGGTTRPEAAHAAQRFGAEVVDSLQQVVNHPGVDWVYINTPPFLHAAQAEAALRAGKHVLVEKPLATDHHDAERLVGLARELDLRLVTNLMQRHNPLVDRVSAVLQQQLLGKPLLFNFINCAVDEGLPASHWFWDAAQSGGIFIEHGVHFFDLAANWFGEGQVLSAGASRRESDGCQDQVWCDVRYQGPDREATSPVLARFYHGFHQSSRTEHQSWQIVCERGRIEMDGWIPLAMQLQGIVDEAQTRQLSEALPGARLYVEESYPPTRRSCRGHGQDYDVYQKVRLDWALSEGKQHVYGDLLYRLFFDQCASLQAANGQPRVVAEHGLDSLQIAEQATRLAANASSE